MRGDEQSARGASHRQAGTFQKVSKLSDAEAHDLHLKPGNGASDVVLDQKVKPDEGNSGRIR
jgi:hypothetical protein